METHSAFWAKSDPFHPLWCHLLDAAAVCRALLPRFGCPGGLPEAWVCYLVALHDIGKADPLFQIKLDTPDADVKLKPLVDAGLMKGILRGDSVGFRHEARSAHFLLEHLRLLGWGQYAIEVVTQATKGHHGDFNPKDWDEVEPRYRKWNPLREKLAVMAANVLKLNTVDFQPPPNFDNYGAAGASAAGLELVGLIVLSDWIASNPQRYRFNDTDFLPKTNDPTVYWIAACREAERAVGSLELGPPPAAPLEAAPRFADVWPTMAATSRPSQRKLDELVRANRTPLGLVILEAPMGEGKTEAAIYLSQVWNRTGGRLGAYIALPTQATSNQLHKRYEKFLDARPQKGNPPRLVHGMAWLMDEPKATDTGDAEQTKDVKDAAASDAEEIAPEIGGSEATNDEPILAREWFQNAKRALLASEGVGTVDQVLFGALNVKHGFLRLYGLTTKTLIVDEVHAYDAYMTKILGRLLGWCRGLGIPVILLSATLSSQQKAELIAAYQEGMKKDKKALPSLAGDAAYPLLTFVSSDSDETSFTEPIERDTARNVSLTLSPHPGLLGDAEATAWLAYEQARSGGCVGVIVNTVRSAQAVFKALQQIAQSENDTGTELLIFHARFRAEKRSEIENEVTSKFGKTEEGEIKNPARPTRAILVGTQVIEMSLDIDMDVLLSEIAPIDLLLQRAGRMHRHKRPQRLAHFSPPTLHVLLPPLSPGTAPDFGTTQKVYRRAPLLRTLVLLTERTEINLPEDFRPLIEGCYTANAIPPCSPALMEAITEAQKILEKEKHAEEAQAKTHLIPSPQRRQFTYAQQVEVFDEAIEGDGKPTSYLRARTRLGDETRSVLILRDKKLIAEWEKAVAYSRKQAASADAQTMRQASRWSPRLSLLRRLFLQKASVPVWWLPVSVENAEGFAPLFDGGRENMGWLRHHAVLCLNDAGQWKGRDAKGKPFTLCDDPLLGLTYEGTSEEEKKDATV